MHTRDDIRMINSSQNAFIPADKTRKINYELNKENHDKLYMENITKTYKKTNPSTYNKINAKAKVLSENLGIETKVECLAKNVSFITLKDHKADFINNPKCRLINPAKPELGKASKQILENVNKIVRQATKVNQWHNSDDVINWFKNIHNKKDCTFIQFDIEKFYPSISKNLLSKSLNFAKKFTNISEEHENIINHACKSL